jgi:ubiquinone/menaquinone biosynthesis C-methylase UbiE
VFASSLAAPPLTTERGVSLTTVMADAEALPFADQSFDLVTCRLAAHHFSDADRALAEFARVLKPGGWLGFTDNVTVCGTDAAAAYNDYESLRDPSHVRVLSEPALPAQIEGAGFTVQQSLRLTKEFEFHRWADRQQVNDADKSTLLQMMRDIPAELQQLFWPRWTGDTLYFSLWELVVVAQRKAKGGRRKAKG